MAVVNVATLKYQGTCYLAITKLSILNVKIIYTLNAFQYNKNEILITVLSLQYSKICGEYLTMKKTVKISLLILLTMIVLMLSEGCAGKAVRETDNDAETIIAEESAVETGCVSIGKKKPEYLTFVDVFGESYQTEIHPEVPKTDYDVSQFVWNGDNLSYEDDTYTSRLGVDVSYHQGDIDWEKVKADGYEFAVIRLGYRGYGETGSINLDEKFYENITNAQNAGLDVGVYFFSQAIDEGEAAEEAEFVLEHLNGVNLQLPVVYDPERILEDEARTDDVSGEQFTKNALMFCSMIEDAGYEPMIYGNMLWEAFEFEMEQVCRYPFWYADYERKPQTPYRFRIWQFSEEGHVEGIPETVDLNIELIRK